MVNHVAVPAVSEGYDNVFDVKRLYTFEIVEPCPDDLSDEQIGDLPTMKRYGVDLGETHTEFNIALFFDEGEWKWMDTVSKSIFNLHGIPDYCGSFDAWKINYLSVDGSITFDPEKTVFFNDIGASWPDQRIDAWEPWQWNQWTLIA